MALSGPQKQRAFLIREAIEPEMIANKILVSELLPKKPSESAVINHSNDPTNISKKTKRTSLLGGA